MIKSIGTFVLAALFCTLTGSASADLSSRVDLDFYADQIVPGVGNWRVDPNRNGYLDDVYAAPVWVGDSWLEIDNQLNTTMVKHLWLEIEFVGTVDTNNLPFTPGVVGLLSDTAKAGVSAPTVTYGLGNTVTWEWVLSPQPAYEWIAFIKPGESLDDPIDWKEYPIGDFRFVDGGALEISRIAVGTACVPLPGSLLLCVIGMGVIGIARRVRRRS